MTVDEHQDRLVGGAGLPFQDFLRNLDRPRDQHENGKEQEPRRPMLVAPAVQIEVHCHVEPRAHQREDGNVLGHRQQHQLRRKQYRARRLT